MKKIVYVVALLATTIGVAPPAHAKTTRARLHALEKTVAKQQRQIKDLTTLALVAEGRAEDAQASYAFLSGCILVQPAGAIDVLATTSTASFMQGSVDGVVPDLFQWLPVTQTVVTPSGPDYLALLDPACIAQPSPAPAGRAHRNGWAPRKLVLAR